MHVALVHMRYAHTGGTERYLRTLALDLLARGHKVTVVCRTHEPEEDERINFVCLRRFGLTAADRMVNFAKDVEKHVRERPYDVVYGLGKTYSHDVIRLGGGCHATYLEKAHDATLTWFEGLIGKGKRKQREALRIEAKALAAGNSQRIVVNSHMVKEDVLARYNAQPDSIEVIHNGVDLQRFQPDSKLREAIRKECKFAEDDFVVLFLGTGYGRKGLDRVLAAFPALLKNNAKARLLVVGYDSSAHWFQERAQDLGFYSQVCFLGGRRDSEACYAAADLYVLPTRYDPFANSTVEALACGLPVITTCTNGGGELIENGKQGTVLGEPFQVKDLAEALLTWSDPTMNQSGKKAARELAEEYSSAMMAARSVAVLEEVARERTAREDASGALKPLN
jgi:UDP-glucose:(heptosyl)LPS alpha-1,3-glucosyltransferase